MKFTVEQHMRCAPGHAFDLMADMRNEPRWNSQVSRCELRSDEPVDGGSRFAVVNRGQEYDAEITTYERPSTLVFEVTGQMEITIVYAFRPEEGGTGYRAEYDFRPTGIVRLLAPLLKPVIGRSIRKETESFVALCDGD
jgi:hypothetical protein